MKRNLLLSLLLFLAAFSVMAQNSSQGKDFWISFMQNGYREYSGGYPIWVENTVMVSAKRACTGTITRGCNLPGSIEFSVEDNGIVFVDIPEEWAYNEGNDEVIDHKAVLLSASDTVSVFISNIATFSFDASFVLPIESLGAEYMIQAGRQSMTDNFNSRLKETTAFLIVAVEDDTEVEITPSVSTMTGHAAGMPFTVTLSAGQTFSVRSNNDSEWRDLSGSTVFARDGKKLAVFNGNTITRIPEEALNGRDHIFEQALPIDSWGCRFVITSSEERTRDIVKITSSADDNFIYRNGEEIAIIGYGDSYEFDLMNTEGSCFIETSEPSVVYLYHTSWEDPAGLSIHRQGDPSMVWIPPIEQRIDEVTFCTFDSEHDLASIEHHYINIVVHRLDTHRLLLDGEPIDNADFHPVAGSDGFCFVRKEIEHGTHHLSCESGLIAHVYGFGEARGYAYCVGANVLTLRGKLYINGLWSGSYPNGYYVCTEHNDAIRMRVVTNYFVEHVDWVFDDGQTAQGIETSHLFEQVGDYQVKAYIVGYNTLTLEPVSDTLGFAVHVGEPSSFDESVAACDSIEVAGQVFHHSVDYEFQGTNIYGCDSTYRLKIVILETSPHFEIYGDHWPIGGSELHVGVSEYSIRLDNPETMVDTVIWQIDNPHWKLEPHGKGETCTLLIYTFLLEPVMLHATAINTCDTIHHEFFVQTSYYDLDEHAETGKFEVYPNPTDGQLTLYFGELEGHVEILIYNALGQEVDRLALEAGPCKERVYSMPNLRDGLYYFVLKGDTMAVTRKVMLKR